MAIVIYIYIYIYTYIYIYIYIYTVLVEKSRTHMTPDRLRPWRLGLRGSPTRTWPTSSRRPRPARVGQWVRCQASTSIDPKTRGNEPEAKGKDDFLPRRRCFRLQELRYWNGRRSWGWCLPSNQGPRRTRVACSAAPRCRFWEGHQRERSKN